MSEKQQYTPKGLTFQTCDEKLVLKIVNHQEKNGLPTFIAAVRQLCSMALEKK